MEEELKNWLVYYRNADHTRRDVLRVSREYLGLNPCRDTYNFNDGSQLELVNLKGTIPVPYKGIIYNIPILIWLMDTHPQNAPICYVKPTADMSIKVSMFVDQNGKIYLPYLHDWVPHDSDLLGLIHVLICTFGEHPPVFAKSKEQVQPLPYPKDNMLPHGAGSSMSQYRPPSYPVQTPQTGYNYNMPYVPTPGYPPYGAFPTPYPAYPTPVANNAGTIKDEHIKESLLSAIEEKLMRRMNERFQQNQAEMDTLQRTLQELKQGKMKLDGILEQLTKEKNDLDKNITVLKDKEQELDKAIERLSNQESIDVDDAVTTTAPLYKQLLNAFAEEAALEDAIYYMGEALRCGVIDLDVFLRQVRTLSRKQFMLRALMQKCRQKAGLAPV
ncbi:PREDICTED: tumor susceptibility gene 101 protein [Nicrophorus vespilloides]|uniref:Tumor susceptibility gene 101 protein n=1 Tax=Nicrophorus vespilloides TaxID=110193 RepID=A0ABM1N0Z6_NICVS|nr:PREDICTED: tumor susceptibility gene 101 protein [Nicrophorus vespilloides]